MDNNMHYNYIDDILLAGKEPQDLFLCYRDLQQILSDKGLQIPPEIVTYIRLGTVIMSYIQ